jgi:type I restriction enzyme R subunit
VAFYETTPERRIQTYKRDLKFFHNLRMSVKIRYAEAVDFRDYEQKIRKLLDDHIDAQGVRQLTPEVEIFDTEQFDELVESLATPRARAEAILNHLKRTVIEKMETDPAYYRDFSQMIEETLRAIADGRLNELEALETAKSFKEQETSGYRQDVPQRLRKLRDAPAYYGAARDILMADRLPEDVFAEIAIKLEEIIEAHKIRDWTNNTDVHNKMANAIDDYILDVEDAYDIRLSDVELVMLIDQVIDIARKRA